MILKQLMAILKTPAEWNDFVQAGYIKPLPPRAAQKLLEQFGPDFLDKIEQKNPEVLASLGGRGPKVEEFVQANKEHFGFLAYLFKLGVTGRVGNSILQWVVNESSYTGVEEFQALIEENPYQLCEVSGLSFEKVDAIALSKGCDPHGELRANEAFKVALTRQVEEQGGGIVLESMRHTLNKYLQANGALTPTQAREKMEQTLTSASSKGLIKSAQIDGKEYVFSEAYFWAEELVGRHLLWRSEDPKLKDTEKKIDPETIRNKIEALQREKGLVLKEEQKVGIELMLSSQICVIDGKPGTGKTTLLRIAGELLEKEGFKMAYLAPTGKASKRMSESLERPTSTVHLALVLNKDSGKEKTINQSFKSKYQKGMEGEEPKTGKAKPKELTDEVPPGEDAMVQLRNADYVVVDESSMLDTILMARLMEAIGPKTKIVLIGDPNQLPSVGAGRVLRDIIGSGAIPVASLKQVMRQSEQSNINTTAQDFAQGNVPELQDRLADCMLLEIDRPDVLLERIKKMLESESLREKYDPVFDVQVLTPNNEGMLGVNTLNLHLQAMLNPLKHPDDEIVLNNMFDQTSESFRIGDKIIQVKNDYNVEWKNPKAKDPRAQRGKKVYNGEMGRITRMVKEYGNITGLEIEFDDGKIVEYEKSVLRENIKLAYAITIHKSQGSEAPVVFMIAHRSCPNPLKTKNLFYTGLTRARNKCIILGDRMTLKKAVLNDAVEPRKTRLQKMLTGELPLNNAPEYLNALVERKVIGGMMKKVQESLENKGLWADSAVLQKKAPARKRL